MAAAQWFAPADLVREFRDLARADAETFGIAAVRRLTTQTKSYWTRHASWGGRPLAAPADLVGKDRAAAIVLNALVPMLALSGAPPPGAARLLERLPREPVSEPIRRTAQALFGADHPPSLYATGLRRQGLLQIFSDFCLLDRSGCGGCTFPTWLATSSKSGA